MRLGRVGVVAGLVGLAFGAQAQVVVGTGPAAKAKEQKLHDWRYGVRLKVPKGWALSHKDGEVSTFRLDAKSAGENAKLRAVASMDFNPLPLSTLSSAIFYYSVESHAGEAECAVQAGAVTDVVRIGGMDFAHGHDEHGEACVEARDEVYAGFRKGKCYRFDLVVNTFCADSSGAQELTVGQLKSVEERMTAILSTVTLSWEKSGASAVPVPDVPVKRSRLGAPK